MSIRSSSRFVLVASSPRAIGLNPPIEAAMMMAGPRARSPSGRVYERPGLSVQSGRIDAAGDKHPAVSSGGGGAPARYQYPGKLGGELGAAIGGARAGI